MKNRTIKTLTLLPALGLGVRGRLQLAGATVTPTAVVVLNLLFLGLAILLRLQHRDRPALELARTALAGGVQADHAAAPGRAFVVWTIPSPCLG